MRPRDLRRYTRQTNVRLLVGLVLLLLAVGNGLIFLLYGSGAALMGLVCMAAVVIPVLLTVLYLNGLEWLRDRLDPFE